MMDNEYRNTGGAEIDYTRIWFLKSYTPTSPLGKLYQSMLYTDATMKQLKRLIDSLSAGDRNLLYYSIWKNSSLSSIEEEFPINWGREHCLYLENVLAYLYKKSLCKYSIEIVIEVKVC